MREINYYKTASGNCPVQKFIDSLSPKQQDKIFYVFGIIEDDEVVSGKFLKPLINNLWEIKVGANGFRFIYFLEPNNLMILTNGFAKKTGETPLPEKKLAKQRRKDYLKRKESK
ncbi:type II toxin-antitoxin system RelE/ParE family toxin [Planktothrix mougeotii]|uniref:Type II toxin-antitoxin system RelE/ParE family toxin n=1 Tax=Planktothrix mougeotii LEGE 06226 TaxID=1828728 RepID=A0ABR9UHH7_9CYAN|nr:type II toxin-antitoxin system RelE/ParE family toxin [Planktothrix mougeotii]MBE9145900.1 type II toxin-antitoxin system RelE/ParE family toxin [Planktothrix mougeotii LEGE 06226]